MKRISVKSIDLNYLRFLQNNFAKIFLQAKSYYNFNLKESDFFPTTFDYCKESEQLDSIIQSRNHDTKDLKQSNAIFISNNGFKH
ncbi:MAG: hypothetical protein MHPSP_000423, partial [Paramarteilia canceri]